MIIYHVMGLLINVNIYVNGLLIIYESRNLLWIFEYESGISTVDQFR